jgi:predicted ester cyclase
MNQDAALTCVREHFEELWNEGRLDRIDKFFSKDFMNFGGAVTNAVSDIVTAWRTAFPDLNFSSDSMVLDGDTVRCEMSFTGTHTGDFRLVPPLPWKLVLPPTGKSFAVKQYHRFVVKNGLIVEHFAIRDDLGMFSQLGLLGALATADAIR